MNDLMFLLPSKGRPKMLQSALDALRGVETPHRVCCIVDEGDDDTCKVAADNCDGDVVQLHKNDIGNMIKSINNGYKDMPKAAILSFWSDDLSLNDDSIVDVGYKWLMDAPDNIAGVIFPYRWEETSPPVLRYMSVPRTINMQNEVKTGPAGYSPIQNPHFRGGDGSKRHPDPMIPFFNFGLLRTSVFESVGMLSEEYPGYCCDDDLMMKMYVKGYSFGVMRNSFINHISPDDDTYREHLNNTLQYGLRIRTAKWGPLGYVECVVGS